MGGQQLLQRIVPDIERALNIDSGLLEVDASLPDLDAADNPPGALWDPEQGEAKGGVNWADEPSGGESQ